MLWLLVISMFSIMLISSRFGYITIILNTITYLLHFFITFEIQHQITIDNQKQLPWFIIGVNFFLTNFAIVFSMSLLLKWLINALKKENNLKTKLEYEKNKTDRLSNVKSNFISKVSHELRTPVNAIVGFSDIISDHLLDENIKEYFEYINHSSYKLLNIVDALILFSEIENNEISVNYNNFKIEALISEINNFSIPQSPPNISFNIVCVDKLKKQTIYSDKEKLKNIIANLILNAFKFTPKGKVELKFDIEEYSNELLISIKDSNNGINPKVGNAIFESFYQEDNFTDGMGLGLTITKHLVKMLKGKIWYSSENKDGNVFFIQLPYK